MELALDWVGTGWGSGAVFDVGNEVLEGLVDLRLQAQAMLDAIQIQKKSNWIPLDFLIYH